MEKSPYNYLYSFARFFFSNSSVVTHGFEAPGSQGKTKSTVPQKRKIQNWLRSRVSTKYNDDSKQQA